MNYAANECRSDFLYKQAMSNGLMSFIYDVISPGVQGFPRKTYPLVPIVASLWTPFIEQNQGRIYRRITNDSLALSWVREIILSRNPDLGDYQPTVAIVVTWHNFVLPNGELVSMTPPQS